MPVMVKICNFCNLMWAVDQKPDNHLEWPYFKPATGIVVNTKISSFQISMGPKPLNPNVFKMPCNNMHQLYLHSLPIHYPLNPVIRFEVVLINKYVYIAKARIRIIRIIRIHMLDAIASQLCSWLIGHQSKDCFHYIIQSLGYF